MKTNTTRRAWHLLLLAGVATLALGACLEEEQQERDTSDPDVVDGSDAGGDTGTDPGSDTGTDAGDDTGTDPVCAPEACGPAPGVPSEICADGSVSGASCERTAAGDCGWVFTSCDDPAVCGADECGPAPEVPTITCEDGTVAGPVCELDAAGNCGWNITTCDDADGCYSDEDCGAGEHCTAIDVCAPDPSCPECDVCYGWCELASGDCSDDSDCPVGELCFDGVCEGAGCTAEYDPVCGVDGNTYGNACEAAVAHVDIAYEGECRGSGECSDEECGPAPGMPNWECEDGTIGGPFCGRDAAGNCGWNIRECDDEPWTCVADSDCNVYEFCIEGACEDAACYDLWAPVCGVDGDTYGNDCEARAAHVEIAYEGECESGSTDPCASDDDCEIGSVCASGACEEWFCTAIYDPVCGVDGNTYGNACSARLAHVDVDYEGECGAP